MTISIARNDETTHNQYKLLPLWVAIAVYALLIVMGNVLLNDPDSMWHITVGQWILDHNAVPEADIYSFTKSGQPWISTEWLAQVLFAGSFSLFGWSGPVVLAAGTIAGAFGLLASFLNPRLGRNATLVFIAIVFGLTFSHLLARPHALSMPLMVAWFRSLVAAADRNEQPSFWLLPLMALWANLHGGFIFGLVMILPMALDAVANTQPNRRRTLAMRWLLFAVAALAAGCCTPYGWGSLLASQRILSLGSALQLIREWRPADFSQIGFFELTLLLGIGFVLYRGITLPPMRVAILLGLVHMALAQTRASENLALVAPILLAAPLARQLGSAGIEARAQRPNRILPLLAGAMASFAATVAFASVHPFAPNERGTPVTAVVKLKRLKLTRVFNDYDFGGYLIAQGVQTFIDGRTELFGEQFFVDHNAASGLMEPDNHFRLLEAYKIEATFMRTESAATKLLDHMDGWQKVYSDDIATIHVRRASASRSREPVIAPKAAE